LASSPSRSAKSPASNLNSPRRKPKKPPLRAAQSTNRTAIIVLGMHRSGTSALTGVLARMGCDLPKTEMPTNASNAKGFYESHEVYRINNTLLDSTGSSWQDWQPLSPNWTRSSRAEEFKEAIAQVFADEFGTSRFFALKDPHTCRLFPFWEPVVREAGCKIVVIHTHRNPLEVAQSLQNHKKLPLTTGMMLWLRYVLDAEAASRNHPRSFTSFGRLMQNWRLEIDRIENNLGLVFPRRSLQSAGEVDEFLTFDLKHFNYTLEDVEAGGMVNDWVRTVYQILEKWAAQGESSADRKVLDQINALFSSSSVNFGPMIQRMQQEISPAAQKKITQLQEDMDALAKQGREQKDPLGLAEERDQAVKARDAQDSLITALEQEIRHQAQAHQEDLDQKMQALEAELAAARDQTDALATTQSALRQRQLESEQAHDTIKRLRSDIERLAADQDAQAQISTKTITALETVVTDRSRDVARFERENAELRSQLQNQHEEIANLSSIAANVARERDQLKLENDRMRLDTSRNLKKQAQQISTQQAELETALNSLHEAKVARDYFQGTLTALQSSSSWRMTGPLRRLTRLFRR